MNFRDMAEQNESWIIKQRRYFHAHPELSFEERNTTHEIGNRLKEMGLIPHYYPDYNGLWTMIKGGKSTPDSKTIALRADIDALPVEEHTGLSFCSQNPGIMHACGHDCHIAMLLGGIRLLMAQKEQLKGNVKIIFQAAEESCHGAQYYVEHGFLDDVKFVFPDPMPDEKKQKLTDILEQDVDKKYYVRDVIRESRLERLKDKNYPKPYISHENMAGSIPPHPYSSALRAGASANYILINDERRPTEREMLRIQGFPDTYKVVLSYGKVKKQCGNSVAVPVIKAVAGQMMVALKEYEANKQLNGGGNNAE